MKRVKAACLLQTLSFQSKDVYPSEFARAQVEKEYEDYLTLMQRRGTQFRILEKQEQSDGSILVKLMKQNNQQPVGDYFD